MGTSKHFANFLRTIPSTFGDRSLFSQNGSNGDASALDVPTVVELCDGAELRTAVAELQTKDMQASPTTAAFFEELSARAAKARLAWRLGATNKAWRDAAAQLWPPARAAAALAALGQALVALNEHRDACAVAHGLVLNGVLTPQLGADERARVLDDLFRTEPQYMSDLNDEMRALLAS